MATSLHLNAQDAQQRSALAQITTPLQNPLDRNNCCLLFYSSFSCCGLVLWKLAVGSVGKTYLFPAPRLQPHAWAWSRATIRMLGNFWKECEGSYSHEANISWANNPNKSASTTILARMTVTSSSRFASGSASWGEGLASDTAGLQILPFNQISNACCPPILVLQQGSDRSTIVPLPWKEYFGVIKMEYPITPIIFINCELFPASFNDPGVMSETGSDTGQQSQCLNQLCMLQFLVLKKSRSLNDPWPCA
ncbi:hypothetical protein CIHG_03883 [Coccidioides immitis H538.4]|uniref:Uncharacterized protein n=1 Tax=Coccidioides immitis H538.4 TaxID=396776 RepID=A0A0J8RND4_COCIT|nr:hypothetical protein CIHG_03883 [Coccidioides immitis H538.4]